MKRNPDFNTLPPFYKHYVLLVEEHDFPEVLTSSGKQMVEFIRSIPENKGEYRYAEGKWTIKELICHIMDAERIFAYRALRFARQDKTPLAGFEENDYAPRANAHARTINQLADEYERLRATTIDLFNSFTEDMLQQTGMANNNVISVINIGYVISGHETHHRNIVQERYLVS